MCPCYDTHTRRERQGVEEEGKEGGGRKSKLLSIISSLPFRLSLSLPATCCVAGEQCDLSFVNVECQ